MSDTHLIGDFESSFLVSPTIHADYHVCDFKGEKKNFLVFYLYHVV